MDKEDMNSTEILLSNIQEILLTKQHINFSFWDIFKIVFFAMLSFTLLILIFWLFWFLVIMTLFPGYRFGMFLLQFLR